MKTIERYILNEFLKLFTMAVAAFIVLFIMVDVFENMDNLLKYKVPPLASVVFFAYKVPFIVGQIAPVALLVSVLISLGLLSRTGELTAVKAGGVRLLRVMTPLIVFGLAVSAAVMVMNESVTHVALKKIDSFRKEWFGVQGGSFGKEGMWVRTSRGIYNVRRIDTAKDQLLGVTFYEMEKPFKIRSLTSARLVRWQDKKWVAVTATVWSFAGSGEAATSADVENVVLEGLAKPQDLANVENLQKNMSFQELKKYVRTLEADGYEAARYKLDLYNKVSFPLVNFIMVLVGIPFALKTGRHSGIAAGVALSVVIAFSYWVIFAVTRSLGQSGMVPPFVAAGFPDVLFFAIGALMMGYVRE